MEVDNRNLIAVDFVGIVQNNDKFVEALGGPSNIDETFNSKVKRLSIKLHPGNTFLKGAFLSPSEANALLMKIRVRKRPGNPPEIESARVHGIIGKRYECKGFADYQYLPCARKESSVSATSEQLSEKHSQKQLRTAPYTYTDMSAAVHFTGIPTQGPDWMLKPTHDFQYITPNCFSRVDVVMDYYLREIEQKKGSSLPKGIIAGRRDRPRHMTQHVSFNDPVPTEVLPTVKARIAKFSDSQSKVHSYLKKAFAERPVWCRPRLLLRLYEDLGYPVTPNQLKFQLPTVSYLTLAPPWRAMHVRIGYDLRKNPESKIYQTVDFRIYSRWRDEKLFNQVTGKRSVMFRQSPGARAFRYRPIRSGWQVDSPDEQSNKVEYWKRACIFEPSQLPTQLLTFYQMCDIKMPEVQALVHQNDGKETVCTESDGWLAPGAIVSIRSIMSFACETTVFGKEEAEARRANRLSKRRTAERKQAMGDVEEPKTKQQAQEEDDEESELEGEEMAEALQEMMDSESSEEEDIGEDEAAATEDAGEEETTLDEDSELPTDCGEVGFSEVSVAMPSAVLEENVLTINVNESQTEVSAMDEESSCESEMQTL